MNAANTTENFPLKTKTYLFHPWDIFKETWIFYRHHWRQIFAAVRWPLLVAGLGLVLNSTLLLTPVGLLLDLGATFFGLLALLILVSAESVKLDPTHIYPTVWRLFWPFTGLVILIGLIIIGGLTLLVIPGLVLAVYLILAPFILIERGASYGQAMLVSWEYIKRFWWAVCGRLLIFGLGAGLLLSLLGVLSWLWSNSRWSVSEYLVIGSLELILFWLLIAPLGIRYLYLIYLELKKFKPALEVMPVLNPGRRSWLLACLLLGVLAILAATFLAGVSLVF